MDLGQMIVDFVNNINIYFWRLLFVIASLTGFWWAGLSLSKLFQGSKFPGQSNVNAIDILSLLFVAAVIFNLSAFINKLTTSIGLGTTDYGTLAYSGAAAVGGRFEQTINAVLTVAAMGGGLFAFKGVLLLKKSSSGYQSDTSDYFWKACTHMFGGAILVEIPRFLDAVQTSFGLAW